MSSFFLAHRGSVTNNGRGNQESLVLRCKSYGSAPEMLRLTGCVSGIIKRQVRDRRLSILQSPQLCHIAEIVSFADAAPALMHKLQMPSQQCSGPSSCSRHDCRSRQQSDGISSADRMVDQPAFPQLMCIVQSA